MLRSRSLFTLAVGVFASMIATAACQSVLGIHDEDGIARLDEGPLDGSAEASSDPCVKVRPPPPPAASDVDVDGDVPTFILALHHFRFRPTDGAKIGYDLDDHCTGIEGSTTADSPCLSQALPDDPGGVDNGFGRIVDALPLPGDAVGEGLTKSVEHGRPTMLFQISQYNGLPNDDEVKVALVTAQSLQSVGCSAGDGGLDDAGADAGADASLDTDGGAPTISEPRWDGCDRWHYAPESSVVGDVATDALPGYVTNGKLVVVGAPNSEFTFGVSGATLKLHAPILAGDLVGMDSGAFGLQNATLTGRSDAATLIGLIARIEVDLQPICEGFPALLTQAKTRTCAERDLSLPVSDDGRGLRCNAVSFALGFDAERARLGDKGLPLAPACADLDTTCGD